MASLPTIPLPRGFAGKLLSAGNCLDCSDFVTLYLFTGLMEGAKIPEPGIVLAVHQGKACGGFRRRFAPAEDGQPEVTAACDEQGTFVGDVPGAVSMELLEAPKVLVPNAARGALSNPMRRQTDGGDK